MKGVYGCIAIVEREGVARATVDAELALASPVAPEAPAALAADEAREPGTPGGVL